MSKAARWCGKLTFEPFQHVDKEGVPVSSIGIAEKGRNFAECEALLWIFWKVLVPVDGIHELLSSHGENEGAWDRMMTHVQDVLKRYVQERSYLICDL